MVGCVPYSRGWSEVAGRRVEGHVPRGASAPELWSWFQTSRPAQEPAVLPGRQNCELAERVATRRPRAPAEAAWRAEYAFEAQGERCQVRADLTAWMPRNASPARKASSSYVPASARAWVLSWR